RPDQFILSRKDLHNVTFHIFFIKNLNLNVVAYQRLDAVFAEDSFCLTLINTGFYYVNVVESGNSFYNFSLHIIDNTSEDYSVSSPVSVPSSILVPSSLGG